MVLAEVIERELQSEVSPERALGAKRYLKSDLEFLGVATPRLRRVVKGAVAAKGIDRATLVETTQALWSQPVFELRAAAVELLIRHTSLLEASDIDLVESLLRSSHTWALVDGLAPRVVGSMLERHPALGAVLDRWAVDEDFWMRRAALLALLVPLRRGGGDFERFTRYADDMLEEREFFIRKAIGWVLREIGKRRPQLVIAWLVPRAHRAAGLTIREAARHLPVEAREALLRRGGQRRRRVPRDAQETVESVRS
jgi:3-methyladenine DNA glycosylase AlkD